MGIFDRFRKPKPAPPPKVETAADIIRALPEGAIQSMDAKPDIVPVLRAKDAKTGEIRLEIKVGDLIPFRGVWLKVTAIHKGGKLTVQLQEEEGGALKKEDRERKAKLKKMLRPRNGRGSRGKRAS